MNPTVSSSRIRVLPENLANKIAAGEVIQRPDSVVKELIENSLDAGAGKITLIIKDGGKSLVQVTDDGAGMDEEDAKASFLRHATSKIASYEDLEAIRTYGFRGEALASIGAVARVTMKTRRREDDAAVVVQIDGGLQQRIEREGREPGTTIIVQNLFYNVPARRKFLKSTNTEFRHIHDAVQRAALSHPEVAFQFISDENTIFDLKGGTLEDRLVDLFGQRQVESMLPVEEVSDFLNVSGYIGKPQFGQKTRLNQFLFLNRRYITNKNISHAVFSAYEHLLIKGTFPFYLLFIEVDPHRVDVNVHPSKMEAKFEEEQAVYRFISNIVRRSLSGFTLVPSASITWQPTAEGDMGLRFTQRQHSWPSDAPVATPGAHILDTLTGEMVPPVQPDFPFNYPREQFIGGSEITSQLLVPPEIPDAAAPLSRRETSGLIWQVHNKYILCQIENGLMVIDQHVAHERVLYERALRRFDNAMSLPQQLLFPQTIILTPGDYGLMQELLPHFEQLGFSLKLFGKNTVILEGIPPDVKTGMEEKIIQDLLGLYKEYHVKGSMDVRDNLAKSYSCKAAIKAGDRLNDQEMRSLIDQLFATRMPHVCPHGRPVVLKISIDELDRRFGRK